MTDETATGGLFGRKPETPTTLEPEPVVNSAESPPAEATENDKVRYASSSIQRLKIGRFQFENGVLDVPMDQVEAFEKLLAGASLRTKAAVSKIDIDAAEAIARKFLRNRGGMTRGGDHTGNLLNAPIPGEQDHAA